MLVELAVLLGVDDDVFEAGVPARRGLLRLLDDAFLGLIVGADSGPRSPTRQGHVYVLRRDEGFIV